MTFHHDEQSSGANSSQQQELVQQLEEQNHVLRKKLERTKRQRRAAEEIKANAAVLQTSLAAQLNAAARCQEQELLNYQSALHKRRTNNLLLQSSLEWDATHDCFRISHRGPFATINGLRLGAEAPPEESGSGEDLPLAPTASSESRSYFNFGTESTASGKGSSTDASDLIASVKVPWGEINSALGQVALLLYTLEKRLHSGIKFRHDITPMGNTSKISLRRGDSSTLYNLFSDDSFQFFGRRNFSIALECLVECVEDAAKVIQERDRTIALPHDIVRVAKGDLTVGGLPVIYGQDGVEWTRAMKYLLTDIKHLMTYRALSVWGNSALIAS